MCKKDLTATLGELIEHSGHVAKLLVSSEIALNDGDLALTQKYTKEASETLGVMTRDVFLEVKSILCVSTEEVNDYDIPNNLELTKQLAELLYISGTMLGIAVEDLDSSVMKAVENKLIKSINTIVEIYNVIYNN